MAVLPILSIAAYSAAVVGHHPNIDAPESVEKYHGFLRIGAVVLLLFGFVVAIASFNPESLLIAVVSALVVGMLATYDYMIVAKKARKSAKKSVAKASQGAKQNVAKAGKEYLDAKKEMEKGPDQVTNVHGDAVARKTNQTHVDQSTTNVDTIDQRSTHVDQSKTVTDQRTHVEDSVVNRSDIAAGGGTETGHVAGEPQHGGRQPKAEPTGVNNQQPSHQRNSRDHQPTQQQSSNPHHSTEHQSTQRRSSNSHPPKQQNPNTHQPPQGQNPNTHQPTQGQNSSSGQGNTTNGEPESAMGSGNARKIKYCPGCGEEVTPGWSNCISCGTSLE